MRVGSVLPGFCRLIIARTTLIALILILIRTEMGQMHHMWRYKALWLERITSKWVLMLLLILGIRFRCRVVGVVIVYTEI